MLTALHRRALLSNLLHVHSQLRAMEGLLLQGGCPSPLDQYVPDLSPTEVNVIKDDFQRIRSAIEKYLEEYEIPIDTRRVSLRWALQTGVSFLSVAVAEMSAERLRGYGPLDQEGQAAVLAIQQELDRLLDRVRTYLREGAG